jgi:hypothetical protein
MSIIKAELAKRAKARRDSAAAPSFTLEAYCFEEQLTFIRDPAKFKTAVCSRRAGKTVACAADLVNSALTEAGDVAYITLNRRTAKRIIWKELLKINRDFNLNAHIDNTDLSVTFPNGNTIYVSGAKDSEEIEKFRGVALRKIYIDECQSFRAYIKEFVEDVLENCLTDYDGSLILIGTPGPVPAGYFYDATTAAEGWSHHHWTMHNNPHIARKSGKTADIIIAERAKRRGVPLNDPSILREYFGQWVKDEDALVFKFNPAKNIATLLPRVDELTYVFGVDIGFKDADAIAVLGYNFNDQNVYLVEELVTRKQDITALVEQLQPLIEKYKPVKMVMDAGALGKKIQAEIQTRHQLPLEAADKHRKHEYIKLLNDDLRTAKFKAVPGTLFEEDCQLVVWDYEDPAKPVISDRYHSDITDAALYAWRECKHFIPKETTVVHPKNSDAYMEEYWAKEAEALERRLSGEEDSWGITDDDVAFVIGEE